MLAHSSERENSDSESDASKVETQKRKHSVHAYFRKNQKRSILRAVKYGDLITAEHKVIDERREPRNNQRYEDLLADGKSKKDGEFIFLVADGSGKLSGRDHEFQEPTLRRCFFRERENLSGESHGDREEFQPEE